MEAQSYTAQERRAANQVWAAAGAYGFEPLFLAHNTDGTVDFYMNTIVGLVHKYYGDTLVNRIFDHWAGDLRQAMLDDLAWLYLENAAYRLVQMQVQRRFLGRSGWRRTSWYTPCRRPAGAACWGAPCP